MENLQIMLIDLVTALENDDDTYITSNDTFWDMVDDIYNQIPKDKPKALQSVSCIINELSFYSDQEKIIEKLKEAYRDIYVK